MQEQLLDPFGVDRAIVSCYWGVDQIRHPDFSLALARAINDWLIAEFLDNEERLRGSIVVPGNVPAESAAEVDRLGSHPRIVQVLLPVRSARLYGQRQWHPLWEAIERNDLVAGIHYGGIPDGPPSAAGFPSWFIEEYVSHMQVFQSQLTSLIAEGVFERFPGLRVSMLEGGFTWLGPMLWRLNKEWKGLRREIPWVKRLPAETVREHIKFSTQPLDAGSGDVLGAAVEWLGTDEILMYASDYPHGHLDGVARLLEVLPSESHPRVMADNARTHYRI
jgi:predicted TIM-barrel fold metal-dependent hydrolase